VDHGRDKIDVGTITEASGNPAATPGMLSSFVSTIQAGTLKNFTLFQIADTDYAGHSGGWRTTTGSTYRNAMKVADGWLGQILDAVQNNSALTNKVAIILTADHGGGGTGSDSTHVDSTLPGNYTIPFFLSAPGIIGSTSIYQWMENRYDPAATRPLYTDARQPMRNGDVANLSAALLGLPTVPGSLMQPELIKPVNVTRNGDNLAVAWPAYLTGWALEFTDDLAGGAWQNVSNGLTDLMGSMFTPFQLPCRKSGSFVFIGRIHQNRR
jgi:hypothetical protein